MKSFKKGNKKDPAGQDENFNTPPNLEPAPESPVEETKKESIEEVFIHEMSIKEMMHQKQCSREEAILLIKKNL